jgi:hypothetical protein
VPDIPREWRPLQVGDYIGEGRDRRVIVAMESAGVLLDERAHRELWRMTWAVERCALHSGEN